MHDAKATSTSFVLKYKISKHSKFAPNYKKLYIGEVTPNSIQKANIIFICIPTINIYHQPKYGNHNIFLIKGALHASFALLFA